MPSRHRSLRIGVGHRCLHDPFFRPRLLARRRSPRRATSNRSSADPRARRRPVPSAEVSNPAKRSPSGIEVDRNRSRASLAYTRKDSAARAHSPLEPRGQARAYVDGDAVQFEVVLIGAVPTVSALHERVDLNGQLCLAAPDGGRPAPRGGRHDPSIASRHPSSSSLPDLDGFDTVEVAYYDLGKGATNQRVLRPPHPGSRAGSTRR